MKRVFVVLGVLLFLAIVGMPLLWVLMSSFKSTSEIISSPWSLPSSLGFGNYVTSWNDYKIGPAFVNSIIVCSLTLAILIPVAAMAAYIFAKFPFKGSNLLFGSFLAGMMFPQFLVIVPLFLFIKNLGLLGTQQGLILVYVAFSLPFTVFVLTGFFTALPDELREAALLDGCNDVKTFFKIMMPLARPGLIVVLIFNVIGLWNEYNLALVLLSREELFTLPLGVAKLTNTAQYQSDWGGLFAAMVIVMTPVLAVYWSLKEKIQEAMLAGAVKG